MNYNLLSWCRLEDRPDEVVHHELERLHVLLAIGYTMVRPPRVV
jgi:hypothetical protein